MGLFSEEQKERVKYHLGYTAARMQTSLSFGQPLPRETMFLLQAVLGDWSDEFGYQRALTHVQNLDKIECLLVEALDRLSVTQVGNTSIRQDETDALEKEYNRWANRLADLLGVPFYAYSNRFKEQTGVMVGNIKTRR
jgi:hypothetical protein